MLVIQTAFLGDVILMLPVAKALNDLNHQLQSVEVVVRAGHESIFEGTPYIHQVFIWQKKYHKYLNLLQLRNKLRKRQYDLVINLNRFAASGFLATTIGAKESRGFIKNPLSFFYTKRFPHRFDGQHEVDRNLSLLTGLVQNPERRPLLQPTRVHYKAVETWTTKGDYFVIAPASVWATKAWPIPKWVDLIKQLPEASVYLVGSSTDHTLCQAIIQSSGRGINLAGQLKILETAALMQTAWRVFVNDSGPLHIASSVNAPTTAIFCSTVPKFGFGPLSNNSAVVEVNELPCRPCGLHGRKSCPKRHFSCAQFIDIERVIKTIT